MRVTESLRLLPALLLTPSACQQVPITAFAACCAAETRLSLALSGVAQLPGVASRGLTTPSTVSDCKAAPGCGCSDCAIRRQPRDTAEFAEHYGRPLQPSRETLIKRTRAPNATAGVAQQHGWHASAHRSFSTFAAVQSWQRRQRRLPMLLDSPTATGTWHSAEMSFCRTYSTLEESQAEVRICHVVRAKILV